jgi:flavin reductase (DIM6/NTAB) family NADH-FMN oxidoreductase RutF
VVRSTRPPSVRGAAAMTPKTAPKRAVPRKRWLRLINTGPTVLVSCAHGARRSVIAISWAMPASVDPPLVVISVGRTRASHPLIRRSREFVINIPTRTQLPLVRVAGTLSAHEIDKFAGQGLTPERARRLSAPRVAECPAHLECRLIRSHRCGTHTLFVGEIVGAYAVAGFFSERLQVASRARTLHHLGGAEFHLPGSVVRM